MIRTITVICMVMAFNCMAKADTLELKADTTVVFRGVVTGASVAKAQVELASKCKGNDLYLVLLTPGGSVDAGNTLIETVKGLPCKVHTVTLFAASMGFHFAQSFGTRYIVSTGQLMSHRMSGGMEGEIPGSIITRLNNVLNMSNTMDATCAKRMGISLATYKEAIRDELWIRGDIAVSYKAADKVVTVRCDASLAGTYKETVETFFGPVVLTWSKCPLVQSPIAVEAGAVEARSRGNVFRYFRYLHNNRTGFVGAYITNGKYKEFQ